MSFRLVLRMQSKQASAGLEHTQEARTHLDFDKPLSLGIGGDQDLVDHPRFRVPETAGDVLFGETLGHIWCLLRQGGGLHHSFLSQQIMTRILFLFIL